MNQPAYVITEADQALLLSLARFHYLTAAQAIRLLYPNSNDPRARYTQKLFKRLVDGGYVLRLRALPLPRYGMAPHVFTLAKKGREYAQGLGVSVEPYFRPSRERDASENSPFMLHRLAAIDVMIAAERVSRDLPHVTLLQLLTERELKRTAIRVELPSGPHNTEAGGRRVAVIPDGWFQLSIDAGLPYSIALELDRGTEDQKVWRSKVAAYVMWAKGPYKHAFETDNLTIAVVCPDARRRVILREWTMCELTSRAQTEYATLFVFTNASPVTTPPRQFFFGKLWQEAGSEAVTRLLEPPAARQEEEGVVYLPV
jgi:Replication-relaxation